jgi:excisionase family DNA binding protein
MASRNAPARLAYSPHEGAQILSISRSKFYELVAAGDLKVVKLGARTLVPHSELVRFFASLAVRPRLGSTSETAELHEP